MASDEYNIITHYQKSIKKARNDETKLLHCLGRLFDLKINVEHLQQTGVGKTVNLLRKYDGEVGNAAKNLVAKWKAMVAASETSEKEPELMMNGNEFSDVSRENNKLSSNGVSATNDFSPSKLEIDDSYSLEENYNKNNQRISHHSEKGSSIQNSTLNGDKNNHKHKNRERERSEGKDKTIQKEKSREKEKTNEKGKDRLREKERSGEKDRAKEKERAREERSREDRSRQERSKEDRSREERSKEDRSREERSREERSREERSKEDGSREERTKEKEKSKEEKPKKKEQHREKEQIREKERLKEKDRHKEKERPRESDRPNEKDRFKDKDQPKEKVLLKEEVQNTEKEQRHRSKHDEHHSSSSKSSKSTSSSSHKRHHEDSSNHSNRSNSGSNGNKNGIEEKLEMLSETSHPKPKKSKISVDAGIDSSMGASFSDALGMLNCPSTSKKNKKSQRTTSETKIVEEPNDPKAIPVALKVLPKSSPDILASLPLDTLPLKINDNYKPAPINPNVMNCLYPTKSNDKPTYSNLDLSIAYSSKTTRTKVYSGVRTGAIYNVSSLFDICIRVLQKNIDALEYTGGVPFDVLKPVLERTTPQQLLTFEEYNAYLMEDTDILWKQHVGRNFRSEKRQESESWREMYLRCEEEKQRKLDILTKNIKISQKQSALPIKKTRLAYVDNVVKPPRNIARKQEIFGTNDKLIASPAARVAALSSASHNVAPAGDPRLKVTRAELAASSNQIRPRKAPLMAKTLQFIKKTYKR